MAFQSLLCLLHPSVQQAVLAFAILYGQMWLSMDGFTWVKVLLNIL